MSEDNLRLPHLPARRLEPMSRLFALAWAAAALSAGSLAADGPAAPAAAPAKAPALVPLAALDIVEAMGADSFGHPRIRRALEPPSPGGRLPRPPRDRLDRFDAELCLAELGRCATEPCLQLVGPARGAVTPPAGHPRCDRRPPAMPHLIPAG